MVQRPISHAFSCRHIDFNGVFEILKGTSDKIHESSNPKCRIENEIQIYCDTGSFVRKWLKPIPAVLLLNTKFV